MPETTRADIIGYIATLSDNPQVLQLLEQSLGRVLSRAVERGDSWRNCVALAEAHHIADWLEAAVKNDMPWLSKLNEHGIPRKIAKFGTVRQILDEADKAMLRMSSSMSKEVNVDGETVVMELVDGYSLVRMVSEMALDVESISMGHCIGHGNYDRFVADPSLGRQYLSLRDRVGRPHVTIELDAREGIIQIQGKQNKQPLRRYLDLLAPFFRERNITRAKYTCGLVFDEDFRLHPVRELPEDIVIPDDIEIHPLPDFVLPKRMTVKGDMSLTNAVGVRMPEHLVVEGNLMITHSQNLTPVSYLDVKGSLVVAMCKSGMIATHIKAGTLLLSGCAIETIAEFVDIEGDIDIDTGTLRDIDCIKRVRGDLTLNKCGIERLPDGLVIEDSLIVTRGRFETLPENLRVGRDVSITWSWLAELPEGFSCNGDLSLQSSLLARLPQGLRVAGSLDISGTKIGTLPADVYVGGSLRAVHSMLSRIPDSVRVIDGTLDITGTAISSLPYGMDITVDLITVGSALQEIPEGVSVGRDFISRDPKTGRPQIGSSMRI